jgi:mRNA interferase MazF
MSEPATRGDIWMVRFDPSEGDEIRKIRPAAILSVANAGRMGLHIVVPITGWKPAFARFFWMVHLMPTAANGLDKESAADAFQVKSVADTRFQRRIGALTPTEVKAIATAIALCVGERPR